MAALCPTERKNKLLVKNVPPKTTYEKLTIHFQKKKNGGCGDVSSVTFPKSLRECDQAVIEFESAETLRSVLQHQPHKFLGSELDVSEFPDQLFAKSVVMISSATINKLQPFPHLLNDIGESTGVEIAFENGKHVMTGHWYQVNVAVARIEQFLEGGQPRNGSSQSTMVSKSGSSVSVKLRRSSKSEKKVGREEESNKGDKLGSDIDEDSVEVEVDENIYAYMNKCYPDVWKPIIKKFKVTLKKRGTKVVISPSKKADEPNVREAATTLKFQYSSFKKNVIRRKYDLSNIPYFTEDDLNEALMKTMEIQQKILVGRVKSEKQRRSIEVLAMSETDAEGTVSLFQSMFAPEKNVEIARYSICQFDTKVAVIHGDFRKAKTEAIISEVDMKLQNGKVLSCCSYDQKMDVVKHLDKESIYVTDGNDNIAATRVIHCQQGEDGTILAKCLEEALSKKMRTVAMPIFWPNHYPGKKLQNEDYLKICVGIVNSCIRASELQAMHTSKLPREVHVLLNNLNEGERFIEVMEESRLFKKEDSYGATAFGGSSSRKNSEKEDENQVEPCPICLEDLNGAVALRTLDCQHTFHQACIDRAFSVSKKCPMCMRFYGKPEGTQPRNANMRSSIISARLPGYSCDTIVIQYDIPSGIQGPEHPNPGKRYHGTTRQAYLPNNEEGRKMLLLLRKAFEARLTFTIGRSVTTGADNCVTWNDIHHKTSMRGGPAGFGYPDPGYMTRLRMELADKGIKEDGST